MNCAALQAAVLTFAPSLGRVGFRGGDQELIIQKVPAKFYM
jgi:hypothetical protein